MILFKILYIWTIVIEITICISPVAIVALAKLQNQKAKVLASAVNWKVKNNYKKALAKSKQHRPLLVERFTRNAKANNFPSENLHVENIHERANQDNGNLQNLANFNEDNGHFEHYYPDPKASNVQEYKSAILDQDFDNDPTLFEQYVSSFPNDNQDHSNFETISFLDPSGVKIKIGMNRQTEENLIEEPFYEENSDLYPWIVGEKNQINNENDQMRKSHSEPIYQDPSYFDVSKPENKKDFVKFFDEQKNVWEKLLPKSLDKIHYEKPEDSHESKDKYEDSDHHYGYSIPRPPLPTIYPTKIEYPVYDHQKIANLFGTEHDRVDKIIEMLHEKGDLLFNMLRPLTTHIDSHVLHSLQHHRQDPGYVGNPQEAFTQNHLQLTPIINIDNPDNPIISYIIHVPNNYHPKRLVRSVSEENYVNTGTEILDLIKNIAKNDEDAMILQKFGELILYNLKTKMGKNVEKRSTLAAPILMDPSTKLDVSKTLENLGTLAKTMFEHKDTPLYHVRNLVGSSKDTVLATLKIPNQNFITPSGYEIVENSNPNIESPEVSSRFGEGDGEMNSYWPHEIVSSTFQQVGQVIRNSVRSSQEAINHIGEITSHAKKAIHSAKTAPELLMKTITPLPLVSASQPVAIRSRFGDDDDDEIVGKAEKKLPDKFINMGNLLDAVGISKPGQNLRNSADDAYVNKIWKNLNGAKATLGVDHIHDFVVSMKEKLKDLKDNNKPLEKLKPLKIKGIQCENKRFKRNINDEEPSRSKDEIVGVSFIPEGLTHPFLNIPIFLPQNRDNARQVSSTDFRHHNEGRTADESNFYPSYQYDNVLGISQDVFRHEDQYSNLDTERGCYSEYPYYI